MSDRGKKKKEQLTGGDGPHTMVDGETQQSAGAHARLRVETPTSASLVRPEVYSCVCVWLRVERVFSSRLSSSRQSFNRVFTSLAYTKRGTIFSGVNANRVGNVISIEEDVVDVEGARVWYELP